MSCASVVKYLLFGFNFIFVLVGIAIIVVGGVLLADTSDFNDLISEINTGLDAPQITLIVIGAIIFIIAFLGCCGAVRSNKCMLITFGVFLILIFIVQLAIGIYAAVNFSENNVFKVVEKVFNDQSQNEASHDLFRAMEKALECCGISGPGDYPMSPPPPCCDGINCVVNPPPGCATALTDWLEDAGKILAGVAIGLSFIEIIGAGLAFYQARHQEKTLY